MFDQVCGSDHGGALYGCVGELQHCTVHSHCVYAIFSLYFVCERLSEALREHRGWSLPVPCLPGHPVDRMRAHAHTHNLRPPPFLLFPLSCVHVSGRCGVSSSRDCRTVSLFSLCICSSTHHPAASGSPPADRWWPGPPYLS